MRVTPPHASVRVALLLVLLISAAGASAWSVGVKSSFRTMLRQDRKAPSTPTSLQVTGLTGTSITVAWRASKDNVGVAGYEVSVNAVVKATTRNTTFSVAALTCGTSYLIGVDAYDAAGNRSQQALVITSTSPCDPTPASASPPADTQAPTAPSSLTETSATAAQVAVSWQPSSDNVGVASYGVFLGGAKVGSSSATSYSFSGLSCGATYTVGVNAADAAGNVSSISSAIVATAACPDTLAPVPVANFVPSLVSATSITALWSPSLDNVGTTGYGLYLNGTRVGTTATTTYTFSALTCGTSYRLGADAVDAAGNRSAITTIAVTTSACPVADTTAPSAPSSLTSSAATQTSVTLGWTASTDNVGVTGYTLYRNGTQAGQTTSTSYVFSGLTCGTSYTLAVEARDAASNVSTRPSLSATTAACATPSPTTGANVYLSVTGNDSTCVRNDASHPCATFNRAYHVAEAGDTVLVAAGQYPVTSQGEGSTFIDPDSTKSGTVTFACQGNGDVTFAAPAFAFHPGLNGVTMTGGCFRFHVAHFGFGGYSAVTQNITLDGVHMDSFECAGCRNVTIKNSEVGPFVYCYGANDGSGAPSYAYCSTSDPAQAFWASWGGVSKVGEQQEPYVHNGAAGRAVNFTLDHDLIHGITSKWSGTHTGGLLVWNTDNLRITNTTFNSNAIYDIEQNASSTDSGMVLDSNTFGVPVYSQDPTEPSGALPNAWREVTAGGPGDVVNAATISNNTFANGLLLTTSSGSFSNVLVKSNQLGSATVCTSVSGITWSGNSSCG